ncbi:MAG: hypothetical protein M1820_005720 [Bogoriella megaspora]|nr:MAG: hypothetical protein M1820_005720 [Bogoriella megaspora]
MDWSRESVMMQHVYGHAYCVVSSCSSSDDKGRLFSPREPFDVAQIPLAPGHREQLNVRLRDADNHALWEFQGSPITTRAWTLQERLLAKRILHFHEHRIYFECATTFISEEGEQLGGFIQFKWTGTQTWVNIVQRAEESARDLVKENLAAGSYDLQWKPESYKSTGRFSDFWCLTVEEYTQRALTKTSDKLAAIDGLAQQIQSRSGKRYCAGIWLDSAYNELGWAIVNGQPSKSNRAPSWSWASIDGEVEWGYRNLPLLNKIPALKIHDWDLRRMVASGRTKQALILAPTDQTISEEIGTGDLDDQDSGPLWSMMSLDSDVSKDLNARSDIGQKTTAIPVTCFQISVFKSSKNRDRWFLGEFRPPHYMVSQVLLLEQVQAPGSRIPNFKRVGSGCIQDEFWFKDVADTELTVL